MMVGAVPDRPVVAASGEQRRVKLCLGDRDDFRVTLACFTSLSKKLIPILRGDILWVSGALPRPGPR